ncbi:type II toxin-antitoxin system RelB/DinJ family antitoxin [Sedimentibacter sp.]|uniref:type II toxin-antitoxin system RelB/DinJ family antitoxin n=1 Tax=Sedimentibacter sp. TaxID=1960295 RepID=UPI0028A87C34|nr:type II toxin-antitoxin system RelB/DinJ family antitoxin [Sedimentibacter sp.]
MKTQKDVRIAIRVDENLKNAADAVLEQLGMNMSTAVNIFLRKVVAESAIPFPVSAKQSNFQKDLTVDDISLAFKKAVKEERENSHSNGVPVVRYDAEKKKVYMEYADGTMEYVHE